MAQTKEGARKTVETNIKKYGADYYKIIGSKGGKAGTGHQFAHGKINPSVAGRRGGNKTHESGKLKENRAMRHLDTPHADIEAKATVGLFRRFFG